MISTPVRNPSPEPAATRPAPIATCPAAVQLLQFVGVDVADERVTGAERTQVGRLAWRSVVVILTASRSDNARLRWLLLTTSQGLGPNPMSAR